MGCHIRATGCILQLGNQLTACSFFLISQTHDLPNGASKINPGCNTPAMPRGKVPLSAASGYAGLQAVCGEGCGTKGKSLQVHRQKTSGIP